MDNFVQYYRRQAEDSATNLEKMNASNQPLVTSGGATQLVNVHDSIVKAQELLKRRKRTLEGSGKSSAIKRSKPNARSSVKSTATRGKKKKPTPKRTTKKKKPSASKTKGAAANRKKKPAPRKRKSPSTKSRVTKKKKKAVIKKKKATRDIFGP